MTVAKKKVAVIGGGITGLAAAYYLSKERPDIDVTLFEASDRLGGKIQTVYHDDFIIERGPDSFVARKKSASQLAIDVGLEEDLVGNHAGQAYVLNDDTLHKIPAGAIMGIPTQLEPLLETKLFSLRGKARVALDFVLPRKSNENEDQSLGYFFRKRLGSEVVDNLIEPLLSGIYSGDIDELSLLATFPQFYEVEREYRSLILGMKKTTPTPRQNRSDSEEKRPSAFLTLKNGLESLVKKTAEKLPPNSVRKNSPVHAFVKRGDSGYELRFANDGSEIFDAVIMTTPHKQAQQLLNDYSFMNILRDYPTNSVANVAMAFDASQVDLTKDGTGFVVSRNANYTITACTWTHRKWLHTCPEGQVLLRAYVGKPGQSDIVDANDETIINAVLNDLNKVMTIEGRPHFQIVTRWKEAMPQYTVGHPYRIQAVKTNMAKVLPGVFLAGSSYEGVGIPDCIDQGREAVNEAIAFLK